MQKRSIPLTTGQLVLPKSVDFDFSRFSTNNMGAALVLANQKVKQPNVHRQPAVSQDAVEKRIRISYDNLNLLSQEYHVWRLIHNSPNSQLSTSQKAMEIFLFYLAGGGYFRQTSFPFGVSISTVWNYCQSVSDFFYNISANFINLPNEREMQNLVIDELEARRVIMLLDGFIVPISRPSNARDAYFCARPGKHYDSICVQYFIDKYGHVRHIITGLPGSTHDKTAVEFSPTIMRYLDNMPPNYCILADSAYTALHPRVKTLYRGRALTNAQQQFNTHAASIRQKVERAIGASEMKWRIQQGKENRIAGMAGPDFAAKCSLAAAVLHNRFTNYIHE